MVVTILAHGGQLTGDEMAMIGGGIAFALLFPVAVLVVAARRARSEHQPAEADVPELTVGRVDAPVHSGLLNDAVIPTPGSELEVSKERTL